MRTLFMAMALLAVFVLTASAADTTQPSQPAQPKGTITGKVLHDGKPMPGIRVMVFSPQDRKRKDGAEEKGAGRKLFGADRPKPVAQTVTGADGSFSVDVPAGKYIVLAMGKKIGAAHERVSVTEGKTEKVELQLQPRAGGKKGIQGGSEVPATQPA